MSQTLSYGAQELLRWNKKKRDGGMNADGFEKYPQMVYRANRKPTGGPFIVIDPMNEQWSMANCKTVGNEQEEKRAIDEGWRPSPDEAIAYANRFEDEIALAAAHRAHEDKRLSEKAQAEAKAADEATADHLPEIPEKRKPGRPRIVPA